MNRHSHNHNHFLFHYISLFFLLAGGFILFFLNSGFYNRQVTIVSSIAFLYVFWGIIHHHLKGDLHIRIVIEYTLIAILSVLVVRGAILR